MLVITRVAWVKCARDFNGGDFLHPVVWDHLCPKRKILPGGNYYRGEVILPVSSLNLLLLSSFLFAVNLPLFLYFYSICRFFCLFVAFLFSPFSDVFQSEMWCEFSAAFPNHLQPLVSRVQATVLASKALYLFGWF